VITSAAALVDRFSAKQQESIEPCPVVVTGGLGAVATRHSERTTVFDADRTLRGIRLVCR
jgi:pantothenate kinase type III